MNKSFHFYIVQCANESYYIRHTEDLQQKISDHNAGIYYGYTSKRLPVKLVYSELFQSRVESIAAEHKVNGFDSLRLLTMCGKAL